MDPGVALALIAAVTVFALHFYAAAAVVITCGEPPYPTTLCDGGGESDDSYFPWSLTIWAAPALVLVSAAVARHRKKPWIFYTAWFVVALAGLLVLLAS